MSAITERARRDLYERAEASLGKKAADTLMAHLPPLGWGDIATKADIDRLESKIEASEARVTALIHQESSKQTKTMFAMTLTAVIAVSGLPQVLAMVL